MKKAKHPETLYHAPGSTGHENRRSMSRRRWIHSGLVTCGYLAARRLAAEESAGGSIPAGYTRPALVTERGRAPGMQFRVLSIQYNNERTYAVIFARGDEVLSGLTEFAEHEKIVAAHFTAIGALNSAMFGWFDETHKAYRNIPVNQQVELISLIGNVGLVNGAPQIHTHGVVGFQDGQTRGGHLLQAVAWPTVEVFFTAVPQALVKDFDEATGLELFDVNK